MAGNEGSRAGGGWSWTRDSLGAMLKRGASLHEITVLGVTVQALPLGMACTSNPVSAAIEVL